LSSPGDTRPLPPLTEEERLSDLNSIPGTEKQ